MLLQSVLIIVVILTTLFATYLIVYRPLNNQLKNQTYENYRIVSAQKEMLIEQFIERSTEGANSLSSRTFIRNAIQDYHDGNIIFTELSNLTQPIYEDGFNALVNVSSASRVVDGMMVAEVNESLDTNILNSVEGVVTTKYEIIFDDNGFIYVRIISPIINNDHIIGHDIVTFDMSSLIEELNEGDTLLTILGTESRTSLFNNAQIITDHQEYTLLLKDEKVMYISDGLLSYDDTYLSVTISQNILEQDINTLTSRSLLWSGFLVLVSLSFVVWINVKSASNRLNIANEKRKYFQEQANKDALTGLYSRHYLNHRLNRVKEEFDNEMMPIAVVMSDVNGFKEFNDTYGHPAGDQVLIDIASIFKASIRDNDLLVRYGGDEFLFMFTHCNENLCENIMTRINDKIEAMYKAKNISLAYGYVILHDLNEIESSIKKADQFMYENKHQIKK